MIFGFDFDNTLINYDKVFYRLAVKKRLINKTTKKNKEIIKKILIKKKKN
jgi:FMN phosphatase YigB (HAD superfamily)